MILFLKLAVGHFLADYPLQGDFLAKAKNHRQPIPGVPWYQALAAHSAIQAGMVWLITGKLWLAVIEFQLHAFIDWLKSNENISFNQDQFAHLACKATYAALLFLGT
jgi:hypothetical protein